ncbi:MAG: sodium:proton antiporter [Ignisphaera sp.]
MLEEALWYYIGVIVSLTIAVAAYGIASRPHIVKKLTLFTIIGDAVYILLVYLGYTIGATNPPVYPNGSLANPELPSGSALKQFAKTVVDPVPQVLIVTAIVIGLAVFILMVIISIRMVEEKGTLMLNKIDEGE